jgi:hypothetical protein
LATPRQLRIQYEEAIYHLMSRGDRREEIFRDVLDREDFFKTLGAVSGSGEALKRNAFAPGTSASCF